MLQDSLLFSIISGLIVVVVVSLIAEVFKKILLPWYLDATYSGVRLAGSWNCFYWGSNTTTPHQTISLTQSGRRLHGTIRQVKWADESPADETISFDGILKGEKVMITYSDTRQPEIFFGSLILKIQQNGNSLEGYAIGIEPTNLQIYTEKRMWRKA